MVRIPKDPYPPDWKKVKPNGIIDIPTEIGERLVDSKKLEVFKELVIEEAKEEPKPEEPAKEEAKAYEGTVGKKKVETKIRRRRKKR